MESTTPFCWLDLSNPHTIFRALSTSWHPLLFSSPSQPINPSLQMQTPICAKYSKLMPNWSATGSSSNSLMQLIPTMFQPVATIPAITTQTQPFHPRYADLFLNTSYPLTHPHKMWNCHTPQSLNPPLQQKLFISLWLFITGTGSKIAYAEKNNKNK